MNELHIAEDTAHADNPAENDHETEAKIAEIEEAIIELSDLCESHEELMAVLRVAIAGKRRENAIFAALSTVDEDAVLALTSGMLPAQARARKEGGDDS